MPKPLILNLVLSVLLFAGLCIFLYRARQPIYMRCGVVGTAIVWIVSLGLFYPAPLWSIGLALNPDAIDSEVISGIGGAAYGMQFELYPKVTLYLLGLSVSFICLCFLAKRQFHENYRLAQAVDHFKVKADNVFKRYPGLGALALGMAIMMVVIYYSYVGWDKLYMSNSGRFDGFAGGALRFLSPVFKALPVLLLGVGGFACMLIYCGRFAWGFSTVVVCAVPFISMASRGFSVLIFLAFVCSAFAAKGKWRWLFYVASPFVACFVVLVPLYLRSLEFVGLRAFFMVIGMITDQAGSLENLLRSLSTVACNLSQGFPVGVEVYSESQSGDPFADVPFGYIWRSFSPTMSFIDGFSQGWIAYNPRINVYTPFSTLAELYCISPFLPYVFVVGLYALLLFAVRRVRPGFIGTVGCLAVLALIAVSLTQIHQYQLRTFTRAAYLAALCAFICFWWSTSMGSADGRRPHGTLHRMKQKGANGTAR